MGVGPDEGIGVLSDEETGVLTRRKKWIHWNQIQPYVEIEKILSRSKKVMKYENILFNKEDTTVTFTFNRPKVLNAMTPQSWSELHQAILELKKFPQVKVVILRGA